MAMILTQTQIPQMEQLHDKILAKRAETERQLGQISAAIDIAMRSASAPGALEAGGQPAAAFLALPRFQVGWGLGCYSQCQVRCHLCDCRLRVRWNDFAGNPARAGCGRQAR